MKSSLTDEELAKKVQRGEREAFALLFDRYEAKIIRYGRRFLYNYEDVEDAVQEVFIKVYVNIASFNIARSFSTWIYRIAHNTFINVIKKKGREPVRFFDFDAFFQFAVIDPKSLAESAITNDDREAMNKCLTTLPSKYREPVVLYYFEQKSYQEIADIMHIPVATVGVRLKRARDLVKKEFVKNTTIYD